MVAVDVNIISEIFSRVSKGQEDILSWGDEESVLAFIVKWWNEYFFSPFFGYSIFKIEYLIIIEF